MTLGLSPADEHAATQAFDAQNASARFDVRQKTAEQNPAVRGTAASLLIRFVYWFYERRLLKQLEQKPMPYHIGMILDGNRRHARKRGLSDLGEIYQRGAEKLDEILDWCAELRISAVTLWVCSTENLRRSQAEVSGINPAPADFTMRAETANGVVLFAPVVLKEVVIGEERAGRGVSRQQAADRAARMSFLSKLSRFEVTCGRLVLKQ